MKIRTLVASLLAGVTVAGAAFASPTGAHVAQPASIVDALAASGGTPDSNPFDYDILLSAVGALPFDAINDPTGPTLAEALTGFTGTVFAPNDFAFRSLVADLTNTSVVRVDEQRALDVLLAVAADPNLNNTGVSGAAALSETVKYHVTAASITNPLRAGFFKTTEVTTLTQLPALGLSDGKFTIKGFSLVDGDPTDRDPFLSGRTIRTADGGTINPIGGVLRPLELKVLFPLD